MYEYVKGQGWVPEPYERVIISTLRGGERVRFEQRIPNVGEKYVSIGKGSAAATRFGDTMSGHVQWVCQTQLWGCLKSLYSWGLHDSPKNNMYYYVVTDA